MLYSGCRLGHKEQKDEWIPRLVEVFTRGNILPPTAVISAGSAYSAATAGNFEHISLIKHISLTLLCALWDLSETFELDGLSSVFVDVSLDITGETVL